MRVTILDPSKDVATQRIVSHFGANRYFTVVGNATTAEDIEKGFQSNSIDLGIVFPERFNETLLHTGKANVQVIADGTDPNTATTATNYATSVITGRLAGTACGTNRRRGRLTGNRPDRETAL